MLRHRLVFGILILTIFSSVVFFGGWLDGSLTATNSDDKPVRATALVILAVLIIIAAQCEFAKLAAAKGLKIFTSLSAVCSSLFCLSWFFKQFIDLPAHLYTAFLCGFVLMALLLYQYFRYGTAGVLANCGVNFFSIIYLGVLGGFSIAIYIDFGLWAFLMFIFVIKSADIGAYVFGRGFGTHRFSPKLSPGKTWEGMAGAVIAAMIVAVLFACGFDIMNFWLAVFFGFCFAFIGQFGDLAESMMKRDAEQKDSSDKIPGFGGILDIIDSPLLASPFAYLFFMFFLLPDRARFWKLPYN